MRHTNWEKTDTVFRGRKSFFPHTSSFAVWTSFTLALLLLTGLASYASLSLFQAPNASAVTTVPTKLNFQGRLSDSAGSIKPNGTYNMKFKLYTVATAGTAVWSEDRLVSATQGVTVTNGLFSVQLGSITSLPASLFASGALYLEVELPTPATATSTTPTWTEGPMTPRNQMATSAYAYNSETLDGQDGAWYQDAANLTGTVSAARLSGSYTGITGTGALAAGSIASGFGTIVTANTITGTTLNGTTGINTGAGAGTQRIDASGNLTNIGTFSSSGNITTTGGILTIQGAGTNSFTGSLAVQGSTLQLANFFPEYRWQFSNSSTDANWKKVADVTFGTGLYRGGSFQVDVTDANCNHGCTSNAIPMRFYVSAIRSGGVQDDTDSGSVAGPSTDYVRLIKTALGVYELQVRSPVSNRTVDFTVRQLSGTAATVTYAPSPANGSTVGTIYSSSTTGYTQEFANADINGNVTVAGTTVSTNTIQGTRLISTIATGTAPITVSSTTKVTSLNADLLDGLDSTAFGDATAANQTTILNRIGTNADAAGTTTLFARLASIDTSKLGASADAASSTGSIFARLAYLISSIGATTDAASSTGSVNAKLAYIIANTSAAKTQYFAEFTTGSSWTAPTGVSTIEIFMVGGGGGGGGGYYSSGTQAGAGGGGGGGGIVKKTISVTPGNNYTIVIGAGGTAGAVNAGGGNGGNSTFSTQTAFGGKGGHAANNGGYGTGGAPGVGGGCGGGGGSYFGSYSAPLPACPGTDGFGGGGAGGYAVGNIEGGSSDGGGMPATAGDPNTGGGGGSGRVNGSTATAGGAGAAGYLLIKWWQ